MIVTDRQIALGRIQALQSRRASPPYPLQFEGFGFLDTIVKAVGGVIKAVTGGNKTEPAAPQTITVNVPPPPPKSALDTPGGTLAIVGATAVLGLLVYSLGKD